MDNLENVPISTTSYDYQQPEYMLASQGKRLANYLLDVVFAYIFVIILFFIIGVAVTLAAGNLSILKFMSEGVFSLLLFFFMIVLYYAIMENSTKGRTIGKIITGTVAVQEDLSPMTSKQAFLRSLIRLVPFEPLSAFGGTPWHDKWTKTIVVEKSSLVKI